jgi:UTP pyrophosphatase
VSRASRYLGGYPAALVQQAQELLDQGRLGAMLSAKYPAGHEIQTDKALYAYTQGLKAEFLRSAEPLAKVVYDPRLAVLTQALGTHSTIARVQGHKLKTKREIRVASLFKEAPEAFLKMIVVHELAHLKQSAHDKAFYQMCCHMEPDYHQYEFDLRLYLAFVETTREEKGPQASKPAGR